MTKRATTKVAKSKASKTAASAGKVKLAVADGDEMNVQSLDGFEFTRRHRRRFDAL